MLIASKRRGKMIADIVLRMQACFGEKPVVGLSAVSIVELTHGTDRAQTASHRERRREFVQELCRDIAVHSVTLTIAQLAGRIEGEQAADGILITLEDLVIGAAALHLGFKVATLNVRRSPHIPVLTVVTL